jgi:hypothetical protein
MQGLKKYIPTSKGKSLNVFTPDSMAYETQLALKQLVKVHGDLDEYVRRKLKYATQQDLFKAVSAEQIDAIALAIHNIENGQGIVVGDKTGTGKGRIGASIIRYGVLNGIRTTFITLKSTLFSDMYRDLVDIASDDLVPFVYNNDLQAEIRDAQNRRVATVKDNTNYSRKSVQQVEKLLADQLLLSGGKSLPEGYDFLMTTYSQLQGDNLSIMAKAKNENKKEPEPKGHQEKTEFLRAFSKGGIVILDEAHEAAGLSSNTGWFIREIVEGARGCTYLSATFAKTPDNMPLYAVKTSMQDAGLPNDDLIAAFKSGGVALQEVVASELVKGGQMVRREHSFEGINVIWKYLGIGDDEAYIRKAHWDIMDKVTEIMRDIADFQKDYVKPAISDLDDKLFGGLSVEERKGTQGAGIDNVDYFNKTHNVMFQLLFALKAREVAEEALELLAEDKKVVIAFSSTMGSFLNDLDYQNGDVIEKLDFGLVLQKGLDGVLVYSVKDEEGNSEKQVFNPEDLSPATFGRYLEITEKINSVTTGLSMSPIDQIINIIESTPRPKNIGGEAANYYRVRECTGRGNRITFDNGVPILQRFKSNTKQFFSDFNDGRADVLLINRSASTGVSAHSSIKFADHRQRVMLNGQPELDINQEVQKLGRINRTGQVNLPEYRYLSTTVPSEQRQFMILKGKLRSLDANTTGNQQSSKAQLDIPDFMNKYGGQVMFNYFEENTYLKEKLSWPCHRKAKDWEGNEFWEKLTDDKIPRRVTNRMQLMPIDTQQDFYDTILQRYAQLVEEEKEKGTYDLEVEYYPFNAKVLNRYLFVQGTGKQSPFGKNAVAEYCQVKLLKKPYRLKYIEEIIKENIGKHPSAQAYTESLVARFNKEYPERMEQLKSGRVEKLKRLDDEIALMEVNLSKMPTNSANPETLEKQEKAKTKVANKLARMIDYKQEYETDSINYELQLEMNQEKMRENIAFFTPGRVVMVPMEKNGGIVEMVGIVLNFGFYGLTPSSMYVDIAFNNQLVKKSFQTNWPIVSATMRESKGLNEEAQQRVLDVWDQSVKADAKTVALFATGNILKAMSRLKADEETNVVKLYKYTMEDGSMRNGVFLGSPDTDNRIKIGQFEDEIKRHLKAAVGLDFIKDKIPFLEHNKTIDIIPESIYIKKNYGEYFLIVHPSKNNGILKDTELLEHAERTSEEIRLGQQYGTFKTYTASVQYATFSEQGIYKAIDMLDHKHNIKLPSDKPIELPLDDDETFISSGNHEYKLTREYDPEDNNYPVKDFAGYRDADGRSKFGYLVYNRPLPVQQRFLQGLVPVYNDISKPYGEWKSKVGEDGVANLASFAKSVSKKPYLTAIKDLGNYLFSNNPEGGNPEFSFGDFSVADFGKTIYQEFIGEGKSQDDGALFLAMLKLELAA